MELEQFTVLRDWAKRQKRIGEESLHLWNQVQILIAFLSLSVFIVLYIFQSKWTGWGLIRTVAIPIIYIVFSGYIIYRKKNELAISAATVIRSLLGIRFKKPLYNLLVGAFTGGLLGFNFLTISLIMQGREAFIRNLTPTNLMGGIFIQLLIIAIGEELILRGISYSLLYQRSNWELWKVVLAISVINLLMYSVQIARFVGTSSMVLLVLYRFSYSVLAVILRYRQGSTIPCIACNQAFNLILASILPW